MRNLAGVLLIVSVSLGSAAAQAQDDPPATADDTSAPATEQEDESSAPAPSSPAVFEEIVVTATKREVSARDVPVSIDAFSAKDLEAIGAAGAQDVLLFSPGISVNTYYSPTLVQVEARGTTTQTEATNQASPFGAFLDDIVLANPSLVGGNPNIDAFDLERVEVLKGPQGTLFGGATLAGALRSIPKQPDFGLFGLNGFASATTATDGASLGKDWGMAANIPLGRDAAMRAMSVTRSVPGVIDNLLDAIPDVNSYSLTQRRAVAAWEPTDRWQLNGMFHTLKSNVREMTHTDNPGRSNSFGNESGFSPNTADYTIGRLGTTYAFDSFQVETALVRVKKEDFLGVQADRVATQTSGSELAITRLAGATTETGELRFASIVPTQSEISLFQNWNWLVGVFRLRSDQFVDANYATEDGAVLSGLPLPALGQTVLGAQIDALALEKAVYTDVTRGIGDNWELNLGARLFEQDSVGRYQQSTSAPPSTATSVDRGLLPKLALTWRVLDNVSLRSLVVKGYRFAGFNAVIVNDGSIPLGYDSDELWNYELGVRSNWFDGRLRADATAFFIDWSRIQLAQTAPDEEIYTVNAGRARNLGIEAAVTAALPLNLILTSNACYVDARTAEDFESADGPVPSGTRLPGTPHLTGSTLLNGSYEVANKTVTGVLSYTYQGETTTELLNGIRVPPYGLFGASLALHSPDLPGQPTITLSAKNLANTHGYTGAINLDTVTDYMPIQPRTVTLMLNMAW